MAVDERQNLPEKRGLGRKEPTLGLDLNGVEILFLYTLISVGDLNVGDPENPTKIDPLGRRLLTSLASLFLEVFGQGDKPNKTFQSTLWVDEKEMWLIKAKVGLADEYMGEKVGISLNRKLARLIITFSSGVQYLPSADSGDSTYQQAKKRREQDSASD